MIIIIIYLSQVLVKCHFLSVAHLSSGDVHEHREAGHVITLTADVGVVSEDDLAPLR